MKRLCKEWSGFFFSSEKKVVNEKHIDLLYLIMTVSEQRVFHCMWVGVGWGRVGVRGGMGWVGGEGWASVAYDREVGFHCKH